jgi:hypothetical protein
MVEKPENTNIQVGIIDVIGKGGVSPGPVTSNIQRGFWGGGLDAPPGATIYIYRKVK